MKYLIPNRNLIITLLATVFFSVAQFTAAAADNEDVKPPAGFELVETKQLDKAWVHPEFKPQEFKTVAIKLAKFDFRPGQQKFKHRDRNENYELTEKEKGKLEDKTKAIFKEQLGLLKNYQLVALENADAQTIVVQIKLSDFVNKVPNMRQVEGLTTLYMRQFGAATLELELLSGDDQTLLFKGYVREDIEPIGNDLEQANTITARQQTRLQLKRWAKKLKSSIDGMR